MFQFLKKPQIRNNYNTQPFTNATTNQFPGQFYNQPINSYDINILSTEINEIKRQINDLYQRLSRIENYLGVRENSTTNSNF